MQIGLTLAITAAAIWLAAPIYIGVLFWADRRNGRRFNAEIHRAFGLDDAIGDEVETWLKEVS